jgi:hypothetical protein
MKHRPGSLGRLIAVMQQYDETPAANRSPGIRKAHRPLGLVSCELQSRRDRTPDRDVFAKYLGSTVQVIGTKSSEQNATFKVTSIKQVAGNCGQAK